MSDTRTVRTLSLTVEVELVGEGLPDPVDALLALNAATRAVAERVDNTKVGTVSSSSWASSSWTESTLSVRALDDVDVHVADTRPTLDVPTRAAVDSPQA